MGDSQLSAAKKAKNDEFYTRMTDIEHELVHYKDHFKGKVVLCNCDDPFESNFFKYFALNFNRLGLKRLTAACYSGSSLASRASKSMSGRLSRTSPRRASSTMLFLMCHASASRLSSVTDSKPSPYSLRRTQWASGS